MAKDQRKFCIAFSKTPLFELCFIHLTVNHYYFKDVQTTPGGVKLNIVLSPAVHKLTPRTHSGPTTPQTQQEIEDKLSAAAVRRDGLERLKTKNIAAQLAKV